ncbi:Phenylalanyl-tRNA synthetase alpha chain [Cystobacter fuscus DSM 2262]|uniref:Phenylalanyl-tRNA synthetase n=2 Tax=Cystobacter fuscus TaxID=43 RepID=S9QZX4_CYSF2|nr:Phenylalanyl-tRNA synthetase alpha chain [Cystobacter fuscus DSM 2262]
MAPPAPPLEDPASPGAVFLPLQSENPSMSVRILSTDAVRYALSIRDLTDPSSGPHAMQRLVDDVLAALREAWRCDVRLQRRSPIVSVSDNYDRLRYPPDGAARDERYTRYVCDTALLRTQTSAMIPPLLRQLANTPPSPEDVLLACPGLVYRRDSIDRLHTGEPHQMDLWRVRRGAPLGVEALRHMVETVVRALLPGREWRVTPARHPYTTEGLQIDVHQGGEWVEIGECGLAHPELLAESGLDTARTSGLAMGLGMDRLLMLRKGLDDIRLLRAEDPRIHSQMLDLEPYHEVSCMPAVRRDLSLVLEGDATSEELGDMVRAALGPQAEVVEAVEVLSETPYEALPPAAVERLGISPGQKNVLLRVVLRALDRSLTHAECNELRDRIYAALHRGSAWQWASASAPHP